MEGRAPLILVLQMAKVASAAWRQAIRKACPHHTVIHLHHINPRTLAAMRARNSATGEAQTLANTTMLRTLLKYDEEALVRDALDAGDPIRIVSGIRDPVDRSISVLFFYADFFGHKARRISHRQDPVLDDLIAYFVGTWRAALRGDPANDTFDDSLRSDFIRYRNWFDWEIKEVFGIDVSASVFDRKRHVLTAAAEPIEMLCYRFEDLAGGNPALPQVVGAVNTLLGTNIAELPQINVTENRRARDLYRAFRRRLQLSRDLIDEIYSPSILSTFYDSAEIERMKDRWRYGVVDDAGEESGLAVGGARRSA